MNNPNTKTIPEIWSGNYKSFSEVPINDAAFSGDQWIQRTCEVTSGLLAKSVAPASIKEIPFWNESPAALCAAMLYPSVKSLNILDFGGGAGKLWAHLQASLPEVSKIRLTIVENKSLAASASLLFKEISQVSFTSELPSSSCYEIVHAQSSLQYVENLRDCLEKFSSYNPEYIVLSDLYAGDLEPYVTEQNYYGIKIPHHIFNIVEVIADVERLGYRLRFKTAFQGVFFGVVQPPPMSNFEPHRQLPYACNLIFQKI